MSFIRRCVQNPVAANMLMILILGGGVFAALRTPRELFPEFAADRISISVPYPGAPPSDIERSICLKVEDQLEGIEGVKEMTSISREGLGVVTLELYSNANVRKVLDEVKSEVDKIDFPEEAEDPNVFELTHRIHVIHVAVAGDAPERTLKEIAEEVRDEINDLNEVSQATVSGVRDYEIAVEVSEESLRRHRLTMALVAGAIRRSSFDLPAGRVKTRAGELTIRVVGQLYTAEEYKTIPVLTRPDGTILRLGDIADVRESFEDVDIGGQFNGKPAALVSVFKTPDEDTIRITRAVKEYVARKRTQMPEGIALETWSDFSKLIKDRLDMLVRNGLWGLLLVSGVLWIFLGRRLSFWVAVGIPVSLLGALLILKLTGMSLNMMSMFALIMALGLIVDDAIVVGENVYSHVQRGSPPRLAAVEGTKGVLFPVIGAVVTTWLAFAPLLFVSGTMGRFIRILPFTVILALGFSLLECLVILPPHLAHSLQRLAQGDDRGRGRIQRLAASARQRVDDAVGTFIDRYFLRLYRLATRHRYVTLSLLVAIFLAVIGAQRGGHVPFTGFPKIEGDTLMARLILPTGTPMGRTGEVARHISDAALAINDGLRAEDGQPVVQRVYSLLGQQSLGGEAGSHVAEVIVELCPSEQRDVRSAEIIEKWRESTGKVPEALALTFEAFRGGPGGKALEIRLLGSDSDAVKPVAEGLKQKLATYPGVTDIEDDALPGKMEVRISPKRGAYSLGVNLDLIARQLRDAFYGNESLKIQRGRDEVKVMVRYPADQRRTLGDVEGMRIRLPNGAGVPFHEVAKVQMQRGYTTLRRVARKRVVTVSADVDESVANAEKILGDLEGSGYFAELESMHPGTKVDLRGQRQQVFEALESLYVWFPVALLGIYTVLAGIFKSYLQPIIIMVAIPFGLVGAVIGHWLLGYDVTMLSLFGMVALAGIVVNDSLVLIDFVNGRIRAGDGVLAAAEAGARQRFRPIILTTVTTVLGMTPILLERSFQAQFLKPMVIAISFGLLSATVLTLVVVPSLLLVGIDVRRLMRWLRSGRLPSPEEVARRGAVGEEGKAPSP